MHNAHKPTTPKLITLFTQHTNEFYG